HIGHCLAAAGSLETVATLLSMKEGALLATLNLRAYPEVERHGFINLPSNVD
ncbi:hypothetical protein AAVH_29473, partial [Aphelenchoides avenae]